ncbi:hypothetical protein BBJ29_002273 [Phytophthora kernoviae]|uniref:protein-tyrosine-phosphatase n=1 Tax=Phytophthora kernoviae TaxID=325452 RepID=A0A3F2RQN7_9STRA|nr:hypothetical protein BBJ29_002273 [Phytophthora kernoviae]RLN62290.1 hypothetical protein BBP00_00004875 [Phytophthora kernoviae]
MMEDTTKKMEKTFDGSASVASTCPTGSNRSADIVDDTSPLSLSTSCLSYASKKFRRRRLRNLQTRVPLISVTSLYNRLQTTGVVLIDCRKGNEFSMGHLPDALHCPPVHSGPHLPTFSCTGQLTKTVDDILETTDNSKLREKLERRDLIEVVVIGGNHTTASFLYRMDWGYRFAKMLMDEGRVFSANSAEVIERLQITHVVNMGAITDQRNKFDNVEYLDVAIKDNVDVDIAQEFGPTIEFIQNAAEQNGRVLIHCVQGVSRSSTIVIWYVMLETKCTLSAAYSHVLKCRPLIFPNRGFMAQLIANEKQLYGDQSVAEDELELLQHGLLPPVDRTGSALCETFLP